MFKGKTVRLITLIFVSFSLLLLPLITGCSKKPSPDELSKLEEAKMAAMAAEKELEAKKAERADLEQELEKKQKELNDLKADRDEVKACVKSKKMER